MNYKKITADEYEKLMRNKKDIFNNTFKNTDELIEDKNKFQKLTQMLFLKNKKKMIILKNYLI